MTSVGPVEAEPYLWPYDGWFDVAGTALMMIDWQVDFGEPVIDKPGRRAFYATDLDLLLRTRGITHLIFTGITTDVCVHSTMREAGDRGYECLLLTDCTGATDPGNYQAALHMVTMEGGVFGAIARSAALLSALTALAAR